MTPVPPQTDSARLHGAPRPRWRGYAVALGSCGLAIGLRFALDDILPPVGFPFLTFFPAVILTALFGGLGPSLAASAASAAAAWYFFVPPVWSLAFKSSADLIALAVFTGVLLVDCVVIHVMTLSLARVRAERARSAALAEARRELAAELGIRLSELGRRGEELRAALAEGEAVRQRLATSEAGLQALNQDLQARVEAEVSAREAAQLRATHAERLQALGQLAGGIAHDFNNVLQAVGAAAGLLERRAEDPAAVRRLARLSAEATARGAAITSRLLSFARRGVLRAEPVEPVALLEDMREMLAHTLGRMLTIRVEAPPGLPRLLADRAQLETVLVNLSTNARDAMPEGGALTLAAVAERAEETHPAGLAPGAYLRLTVRDTGHGMTPEVLARTAEPFFTTKGPGQGTGLGLAMARGFAEQSGGALQLESVPAGGTTVTLWLPQAGPAQASPAQAAPRSGELRGVRILLVDDEAAVREALAATLREFGCRVAAAGDAAEALRLLRGTARVDVLVTDLSMPGMDGLGLIRQARACRPGLPALLLTGVAGDMAEAAGADSVTVLRKPVSGAELAAVLATLPVPAPVGPP